MGETYDFSVEFRVTRAYQAHADAPCALREAMCLQAMYPDLLLPLRARDAFAGRIRMSLVGVSPEPGGLGYYCNRAAIEKLCESCAYAQKETARIREMLAFWARETTSFKVRAAYSEALRETLPTDDWQTAPVPAAPPYRIAGGYGAEHDVLARAFRRTPIA